MSSPPPPSSAPSNPDPKPTTSPKLLSNLVASTGASATTLDARIAHINRVLATQSGIDSTLLLLGYSLYFVSSQIRRFGVDGTLRRRIVLQLLQFLSPSRASEKSAAAPGVLGPDANAIADSVKSLGSMCSDVRMFMRLWGLLKIYAGVKATIKAPPKDTTLRVLGAGQMTAMAAYLGMEHVFYLGSKGVLFKDSLTAKPERLAKLFKVAVGVYGAYLVMDYVRLWRVWQVREVERRLEEVAGPEKIDDEQRVRVLKEREAQDAAWWRGLQVDMAYSPLVLHWGGVQGASLGDAGVGLLGSWAGWVGFKEAWRVTA
ncbi:MAG: hypothetical protein M1831_001321 [Alyxoria varia]|nr:MAG: hypothetical protein M1831_001321 [Alyxoria varia]